MEQVVEVIELNGANQPLDVLFKVCQQIFIFMEKRIIFGFFKHDRVLKPLKTLMKYFWVKWLAVLT